MGAGASVPGLRCAPELRERDLSGRVYLITGAGSGIGRGIARALLQRGATVAVTARGQKAAVALANGLQAEKNSRGGAVGFACELGSLASVRALVCDFRSKFRKLHGLVLNAGVMACPLGRTVEGLEMQFGVNHVAHHMLARLLVPIMQSTKEGARVVSLSSVYHDVAYDGSVGHIDIDDLNWERKPYSAWAAYAQSKLANVLFAKEFANRVKGVTCVSVHPGWVQTSLMRHMVPTTCMACLAPLLRKQGMIPLKDGIEAPLHCILTDDLVNGAYYEQAQRSRNVNTEGGFPCQPRGEGGDALVATKLWNATEELIAKAGAAGSEWSVNSVESR